MGRPRLNETKRSQRATLLLTPDDYEGLSILAQLQNKTINDFSCSILAQIVQKNQSVIKSFRAEKAKYAASLNVKIDE